MPGPAAFVAPCLACILAGLLVDVNLNIPPLPGFPGSGLTFNFEWPSIGMPGFPTLVAGFFGALLAGINYVLKFIPPDPMKLPSFPGISLFVDGFMGAIQGLPALPAFNIDVPGAPSIPFPGIGGPSIPSFTGEAMIKMIGMFIAVPFLIIKGIIDGILKLQIKLPTVDIIVGLFTSTGLGLGFPLPSLEPWMLCLALAALKALAVI